MKKLAPAIVISYGSVAAEVATKLADHYPTVTFSSAEAAGSLLNAVGKELAASVVGGQQSELPAVIVLAETDAADEVFDFIEALTELAGTTHPRIWPTFVGGAIADLGEFDRHLDAARNGICDVVIALNGAPSEQDQALALSAWLHVKVPAPPSVLAGLPDSQGQTCRYVAIGASQVGADLIQPGKSKTESADDSSAAQEQVGDLVVAGLRPAVVELPVVRAALAVVADLTSSGGLGASMEIARLARDIGLS